MYDFTIDTVRNINLDNTGLTYSSLLPVISEVVMPLCAASVGDALIVECYWNTECEMVLAISCLAPF